MSKAAAIKTKITKTKNQTVKRMENLGIYKPEFENSINRYAELKIQYDILTEKWYETGCEITEKYTNKAGATNMRKTALYLSIENMRKELNELENILGLTPKGLKAIRAKGFGEKKQSALDRLLNDDG